MKEHKTREESVWFSTGLGYDSVEYLFEQIKSAKNYLMSFLWSTQPPDIEMRELKSQSTHPRPEL